MSKSNVSFEKFEQQAHEYFNKLAEQLGHAGEKDRSVMIWRAVMHTVRDRIQISESFDLMSQLPMLLKGLYAEQWKYHEKPLLSYASAEEMKAEVKKLQERFGENEFDWPEPTETLISTVLDSLHEFVDEGQMRHLRNQLPEEIKELA